LDQFFPTFFFAFFAFFAFCAHGVEAPL